MRKTDPTFIKLRMLSKIMRTGIFSTSLKSLTDIRFSSLFFNFLILQKYIFLFVIEKQLSVKQTINNESLIDNAFTRAHLTNKLYICWIKHTNNIIMRPLIKLFAVTLIVLISSKVYSQDTYGMPTDELTGKIHYQEVVKMAGTKDELFIRAQKWLHKFFRNASSVIKRLDQENGLIEGRRQFNVITKDKKGREKPAGIIKYTFKIEVKEGKYRVRLFDFKQAGSGGKAVEAWFDDKDEKQKEIHAQIFKQIDDDAKKLLASLKKAMRPTEIKTEEW